MNRKLYAMLKAKQEAFCQAYADNPNGAAAARTAGYAESGARQEASRLLAKPEIAERLDELRLAAAERRARVAEELMAKLDPLYSAGLEKDDHDRVVETVRLQAEIAGLIGVRGPGRS